MAVVGVGGVGSWVVEALARSGVGALTLIDLDDVCVTNTNRQLPALQDTVGRPKVDVLAQRVKAINPECRVNAVAEFFSASAAPRLLAPALEVVVDAVDTMSHKALLIAECVRRGYACVTVGAAGGKVDATQIKAGDLGDAWGDELLRQVRRKLRRDHGFAPGPAKGRVRWGVGCVWSPEVPRYPWTDGVCRAEPEPGANLRMDCASGFGAGMWVTAAFGMVATQLAIQRLVGSPGVTASSVAQPSMSESGTAGAEP